MEGMAQEKSECCQGPPWTGPVEEGWKVGVVSVGARMEMLVVALVVVGGGCRVCVVGLSGFSSGARGKEGSWDGSPFSLVGGGI